MGKTTLAMNFTLNVALQTNAGVAVFGLEMPKATRTTNVSSKLKWMKRLRAANIAEQEYRGLAKALGRLSGHLNIDDTRYITHANASKCQRV